MGLRPTMGDVHGPEYQALLKGREMYRLYGRDYKEMMWADEILMRLETRPWDVGYDDKDRADFEKVKQLYAHVFAKDHFNPSQPRVPAGNDDGGQWTDGGGGSGGGGRFGIGKIPKNPLPQDAMIRKPPPYARRPGEDILDGGSGGRGGGGYGGRQTFTTPSAPKLPAANRAAEKIQKLDRQGADDLQEVVTTRAYGRTSPKEASPQIREAADDIEKFLGSRIESRDIKPSKSGDLVIQKGDKKFRMDVKNPGRMKDRKTPDNPHFHFEQLDESGKWVDASDGHKNYFRKD